MILLHYRLGYRVRFSYERLDAVEFSRRHKFALIHSSTHLPYAC